MSRENANRSQAGYTSKADVQAAIDRELETRLGRGDTTVQALAWCASELVDAKWLLFKMARAMGRRPLGLEIGDRDEELGITPRDEEPNGR
jgi:hypothetical protein